MERWRPLLSVYRGGGVDSPSSLPPPLPFNSRRFVSPVSAAVGVIDGRSPPVNEHFPPHKLLFRVTRLATPLQKVSRF